MGRNWQGGEQQRRRRKNRRVCRRRRVAKRGEGMVLEDTMYCRGSGRLLPEVDLGPTNGSDAMGTSLRRSRTPFFQELAVCFLFLRPCKLSDRPTNHAREISRQRGSAVLLPRGPFGQENQRGWGGNGLSDGTEKGEHSVRTSLAE